MRTIVFPEQRQLKSDPHEIAGSRLRNPRHLLESLIPTTRVTKEWKNEMRKCSANEVKLDSANITKMYQEIRKCKKKFAYFWRWLYPIILWSPFADWFAEVGGNCEETLELDWKREFLISWKAMQGDCSEMLKRTGVKFSIL